jgi:hypothetical protein
VTGPWTWARVALVMLLGGSLGLLAGLLTNCYRQ